MKDTKTNSEKKKKKKSAAKKKTNSTPAKKFKKQATKKVKSAAKKKVKTSAETKTKNVAKKRVKKTTARKPPHDIRKKPKPSIKENSKSTFNAPPVEEKITHGEDLHLIPVEGEIHPIGAEEANRLENLFQKREAVNLQQENRKVKDALGSRKNLTKNFRITRHK